MSIIIFIFLPLGWVATGRLLGPAVSLTVPTERAKRLGDGLRRWCTWLLPALYYLLFILGGSADAHSGVRLFGGEELFIVLGLPYFAVPALCLYVGALYVIRDLVRGLRSPRS